MLNRFFCSGCSAFSWTAFCAWPRSGSAPIAKAAAAELFRKERRSLAPYVMEDIENLSAELHRALPPDRKCLKRREVGIHISRPDHWISSCVAIGDIGRRHSV